MKASTVAKKVLDLVSAIAEAPSGLDAIGPSDEFMATALRQHSMTVADVQDLVRRGHEAIRNSDVARIERIAAAGSEILGILRGAILA